MMSGDKTRRTKGRPTQNQEKSEENTTGKDGGDVTDQLKAMDSLQASITAIHTEILAIRSDEKVELGMDVF